MILLCTIQGTIKLKCYYNIITIHSSHTHTNTLLYKMKLFMQIMKSRFLNENMKPLGRWRIDYCSKKMNRKIDLSNEDHCGPCGQYLIRRQQLEKEAISDNYYDKNK